MMKDKRLYAFTLAILFFVINCNKNLIYSDIQSSNYDFIFSKDNNLPTGKPSDGKITEKYGWTIIWGKKIFHPGIDFATFCGANVYSTASGKVVYAGYLGGNGNCIRIRHNYGYETIYSHCWKIIVYTGQQIIKGQLIAQAGATGVAGGNVLHYEIIIDGKQVDPEVYITKISNYKCPLLHSYVINQEYSKIKELTENFKNRKTIDTFGLTPLKIAEILKDKRSIELLK
jgi:murein DD-endopeptidase MepM/ murein hydrolase activator NlpD